MARISEEECQVRVQVAREQMASVVRSGMSSECARQMCGVIGVALRPVGLASDDPIWEELDELPTRMAHLEDERAKGRQTPPVQWSVNHGNQNYFNGHEENGLTNLSGGAGQTTISSTTR